MKFPITLAALALAGAFSFGAIVDPQTATSSANRHTLHAVIGYGQIRYDGHGPEWWAVRARRNRREIDKLVKTRIEPPLYKVTLLAATAYGVSADLLWRKAKCESHLDPFAHNKSGASGIWQFEPSTWQSTPFGSWSIYDPIAQAFGAAWMHANHRGGEWECR